MARRSRIGIRGSAIRFENYRSGISVGDLKYNAKIELMKKHKDAAFYFISKVQEIAKRISDKYGISGTARTIVVKTLERLGSIAVRYINMDDTLVENMLRDYAESELATSGVVPGVTVPQQIYNTLVAAVREGIREIMTQRKDIYNKYVEMISG